MLLTSEFIKDIKRLSLKKKEKIIDKLNDFEEEIKNNSGRIRECLSGFWIIGLKMVFINLG